MHKYGMGYTLKIPKLEWGSKCQEDSGVHFLEIFPWWLVMRKWHQRVPSPTSLLYGPRKEQIPWLRAPPHSYLSGQWSSPLLKLASPSQRTASTGCDQFSDGLAACHLLVQWAVILIPKLGNGAHASRQGMAPKPLVVVVKASNNGEWNQKLAWR